MKTAIIIPVYNHPQRVVAVIDQAKKLGLPIFVIDDGSTDQTLTLLAGQKGISLLRHPVNLGKGAALRSGFAAAAPTCRWALTIDADGQHRPEDAGALLAIAAASTEPLIVIGNRQGMAGEHVPWTSRYGRHFSNFWVWMAGGPRLGDSQSGFRLYPLPEVLQLPIIADRYQYEVEVLVEARRQGIPVVEVGVQVVYQPKGVRVSHFRPWQDFGRNSVTFSRLIFARLTGWRRRK